MAFNKYRLLLPLIGIFILKIAEVKGIFLIVPEDVPTALVGIYGFAPRLRSGNDGRFGFGFRLGNHADLQISYEIGPQLVTRPLGKIQSRSSRYRQRQTRRPLLEFLLRTGLLKEVKEVSYKFGINNNNGDDTFDNDVDYDVGPR